MKADKELSFAEKVQQTGAFKRLTRKVEPKLRSSTKAAAVGLAAFGAMHAPLISQNFNRINDWDSLIILIVTWLVQRLTKSPSNPGKL